MIIITVLLVSGSRGIRDIKFVYECIDRMAPFDQIICGGADGVDAITMRYCTERTIPCEILSPDYDSFGRTAPLIRNTAMVKRADKVLLVWDGESSGTADTLRKTKAMKKPFTLVKEKPTTQYGDFRNK